MSYGKIAIFYDFFLEIFGFKRGFGSFLQREQFNLPPKPVILDAGCGSGGFTFEIFKKYPDAIVYAFDIDEKMLEILKKYRRKKKIADAQLIAEQGDIKNIDKIYKKEFFDCVFFSGALEYAAVGATVAKTAKLLRRGGYFVNLAVRRGVVGWILEKLYNFRIQPPEELIAALNANGFVDIDVKRLSWRDFPANLSKVVIIGWKK